MDKPKIKSSWSEVMLEDGSSIQGLLMDESLDEFDREIKIICLLAGVNEDYFNDWTLGDIKSYFSAISFLNEEPKGDIQPYYMLNGKEYRLVKSIKELTGGQFIDLSNLIKDKERIIDNLGAILAIMLIPTRKIGPFKRLFNAMYKVSASTEKGKKYLDKRGIEPFHGKPEKYMQTDPQITEEIIYKHLSYEQAMGICQFFFFYSTLFIDSIKDYSDQQMLKKLKSVLESLKSEPSLNQAKQLILIESRLKDLESTTDGLL